jgi:hypothetical protein
MRFLSDPEEMMDDDQRPMAIFTTGGASGGLQLLYPGEIPPDDMEVFHSNCYDRERVMNTVALTQFFGVQKARDRGQPLSDFFADQYYDRNLVPQIAGFVNDESKQDEYLNAPEPPAFDDTRGDTMLPHYNWHCHNTVNMSTGQRAALWEDLATRHLHWKWMQE